MLALAKFVKKEIQLRENIVGTGFNDPVRGKVDKTEALGYARDRNKQKVIPPTRVTVLGEIVSTVGFLAETTYIQY